MPVYGHLFKHSVNDHYLFIRQLNHGVSCQAQLVRHCETGEVRVRKVLHRRCHPNQKRRAAGFEAQFNLDAEMARILTTHAQQAGVQLRVPTLYSDATLPDQHSHKYSRVSYWSLCNGGQIESLSERASRSHSWLPAGLLLRYLQHTLETLHFMYNRLPIPMFHGDLHDGNMLMHFPRGSAVPDFYIIDFGLAFLATDRRRLAKDNWDIPAVMSNLADLMSVMRDDDDADRVWHDHPAAATHPVLVAYQMLDELNKQFYANKARALETPGRQQQQPPLVVVPDLGAVLAFVREHAMRELPGLMLEAAAHTGGWRPEQEGGAAAAVLDNAARHQPRLYPSVGALLGARNVPGPWWVAEVEPGSWAVRQVLMGGDKETHHRPNEENAESATESVWCGESDDDGELE